MTAPQSVLRRYTTSFHPRTGELFVYGGFAAGSFALLIGIISDNIVFYPLSVVGLFSAYYFQPLTDTDTPQIGADTRGIYIRKLGHIPWHVIKAFRIHRIAVRSVEKARLQITLQDNWQETLRCKSDNPVSQKLMYRIWSRKEKNMLDVKLEHLKDDSRKIENSFVEIWQNRPVSTNTF